MQIRKATANEMLALWGYRDVNTASPTAKFFYQNISAGNAVFWALDNNGELIGELYVFFDLEDKDFADGETTAYLCAFRVKKEYRRKGLGSMMMEIVLSDLKGNGFQYATIGVSPDEPHNIRLYRKFGFTELIKECHYDPCTMDENMQPVYEDTTWLLLSKTL